MLETKETAPSGAKVEGVQVAHSPLNQQLKEGIEGIDWKPNLSIKEIEKVNHSKEKITIRGTLTSRIEVKASSDIPAYGFFQLAGQETDTPIIFRIKDNDNWLKPPISKGSTCQLEGEWKTSPASPRPSFTCCSYQLLQESKTLTSSDLITLKELKDHE